MPSPNPLALFPAAEPAPPPPLELFPYGWSQRLLFVVVTVVVPVTSFWLAIGNLHLADWKDPGLGAWLKLLVDRPGALAFAPLAALVVLTCAAIAIRPGPWVVAGYCRAILLVGVLLGAHYSLLLPASIILGEVWPPELAGDWENCGAVLLFVAVNEAALIGVVALLGFSRRRFGWRGIAAAVVLLWLSASSFFLYLDADSEAWTEQARFALLIPGWVLWILSLLAGPIWTTDALCRLLWRLGKPRQWPLGWLVLGLAVYAACWRMAVLNATAAFQALTIELDRASVPFP